MILLSLIVFLQYNLLQCVVFEQANFTGLLRRQNANSSLQNSTPGVYQLDPITPAYAFFIPPDDFHHSKTPEDTPHLPRRSQNKISNIYLNQYHFKRSRPENHYGFTLVDTSEKSEETSKKSEESQEFQENESFYHSGKDTFKTSSSESDLEWYKVTIPSLAGNGLPSSDEEASDSSERPEDPGFLETGGQTLPVMLRTRGTEETTTHKPRLKPNNLLPETVIVDSNAGNDFKKKTPPKSKPNQLYLVGNDVLKVNKPTKHKNKGVFGDDNDIFKTMRQKVEKGAVLRMHNVPKTTKKIAYSERMKAGPEEQTNRQSHTHDNNADVFKTRPKTTHDRYLDGNDLLMTKKPSKHKHKGIYGDDNDKFKMMRQKKNKEALKIHILSQAKHKKRPSKQVKEESEVKALRMHVDAKTTKKMDHSDLMMEKTLMHATIKQSHDNDADLFKKKTRPKTVHDRYLDGNDMLMMKEPSKHEHNGIFGDDNDIFEMMKQRKDKNKMIMRMHVKKKKVIVESKEEIEKQSLIQTPSNDWSLYDEGDREQGTPIFKPTKPKYASSMESLRAPLSKNYFYKKMEHRREGYMMEFIIEVMQIIGTKDKEVAHDVIKHVYPIIHKHSHQLRWMGHPFLDETKKFAAMVEVTDIATIQAQATDLYYKLQNRRHTLPADVNAILEYAETMYNDEEGKVLFNTLREFVAFPKIALSGYWLCNSLINAFLRPFRRLNDTKPMRELMTSINLAFKKRKPLWSGQKPPYPIGRGGAQANGLIVDKQPLHKKESFITK